MSDDEVETSLTVWAGRIAAGEARLLAFLGEFDAREQWSGYPSCTSWLSWRLSIGLKAHTQVRAFTRFARPDSEAELLTVVRSCSGEQIERLARGICRARAAEVAEETGTDADARPQHGVSLRYEDDGTAVVTARLPAEQAAIVLAALETCQEQLELAAANERSSAEDARPGQANEKPLVSRQQALLQVAQDWLDNQPYSVRRRAKPRLTAQLDPLSGWARLHNGEMLPPDIARTLELTQFDRGRAQREVGLLLRQFLGAVDRERCRFPGCRHARHLKAHHVIWWSRGGPTDLSNLVLLCHRHHSLIHDEQFTMTLHADRALIVRSADGAVLPAHPGLPESSAEDLDPIGIVTPDTCPSPWALDPLPLGHAVSVLMHLAA